MQLQNFDWEVQIHGIENELEKLYKAKRTAFFQFEKRLKLVRMVQSFVTKNFLRCQNDSKCLYFDLFVIVLTVVYFLYGD